MPSAEFGQVAMRRSPAGVKAAQRLILSTSPGHHLNFDLNSAVQTNYLCKPQPGLKPKEVHKPPLTTPSAQNPLRLYSQGVAAFRTIDNH